MPAMARRAEERQGAAHRAGKGHEESACGQSGKEKQDLRGGRRREIEPAQSAKPDAYGYEMKEVPLPAIPFDRLVDTVSASPVCSTSRSILPLVGGVSQNGWVKAGVGSLDGASAPSPSMSSFSSGRYNT